MRTLVLASALLLFLELALIRWIPAHALYLTFFTNAVLLASFLGLSLGCLRAKGRDLSGWTSFALALTMAAAHAVERLRPVLEPRLDAGGQSAPELVFFGTEFFKADLSAFPIPVEALGGLFFLLAALCLVGPGQELGRLLDERGGGPRAYGANLLGSLAGVAAFAAVSLLELPPLAWFLACAAGFEWLARRRRLKSPAPAARLAGWGAVLALAAWTSGGFTLTIERDGKPLAVEGHREWSPYYRIDWFPAPYGDVVTNLLSHQRMTPLSEPAPVYALPHVLLRAGGARGPGDVLVIGAGTGNDVARALAAGALSVDAVEIDPAILRVGRAQHPDKPYADPRVRTFVADGRRFLREDGRKYDLIVYALVDSLVLHSAHSSVRLESWLFTREALEDARRRLKPGGTLAVYNFFRQGWVAARLHATMAGVFGAEPVAVALPPLPEIGEKSAGGLTLLLAGETDGLRRALARGAVPGISASAVRVPEGLAPATDDWPFLYLRRPSIPAVSRNAALVMGALSALLLGLALRGRGGRPSARLFFLGAGFMLLETKAVVGAALFLGSTWVVNSFVFAGVLAALLGANALAARLKPTDLRPWFAALFASLAASWAVRPESLAAAALLSFLPLVFAGVVFSSSYARAKDPAAGFGANVAGAMAGGLAENASMLLGFRGLSLVAAAFYALAFADAE
jgi:SAM-dependent methyltransferase